MLKATLGPQVQFYCNHGKCQRAFLCIQQANAAILNSLFTRETPGSDAGEISPVQALVGGLHVIISMSMLTEWDGIGHISHSVMYGRDHNSACTPLSLSHYIDCVHLGICMSVGRCVCVVSCKIFTMALHCMKPSHRHCHMQKSLLLSLKRGG